MGFGNFVKTFTAPVKKIASNPVKVLAHPTAVTSVVAGKWAAKNPTKALILAAPGIGLYADKDTRKTAIAATAAGAVAVGGISAVQAAKAADGLSNQTKNVSVPPDNTIQSQVQPASAGLGKGAIALGVGVLALVAVVVGKG